MSNEIREKDHEWVKTFHSNFDRLLALLERVLEKRQPSAYGDELLTDKEVAYLLKVSRRTLQDYRNNGILPYTQVGGKILYRASDIEKTLMKGYKEAYRYKRMCYRKHPPQRTHKDFDFSGGSAVCRLPILFVFLKNSLSK